MRLAAYAVVYAAQLYTVTFTTATLTTWTKQNFCKSLGLLKGEPAYRNQNIIFIKNGRQFKKSG